MRKKFKKWRKSENAPKEVSPADNIVFSPPADSAKIVRSQSPKSRTGLPHYRGSAETSDKGERENEDGARRAQKYIWGNCNNTCEPDLEESHEIHKTKY